MRIKDVVTLKEVVSDLNDGKAFYDQRETGVGDYFNTQGKHRGLHSSLLSRMKTPMFSIKKLEEKLS